jgi:hypothetical protein|tara:strand:- start:45 stop:197 length:153 start_codon:yes stop_codon:yes gene_type:complete
MFVGAFVGAAVGAVGAPVGVYVSPMSVGALDVGAFDGAFVVAGALDTGYT